MLSLSAKTRQDTGGKAKTLLEKGIVPAVLYGYKIKNLNLEIDFKEFIKVFKEAGESSLFELKVKDAEKKDYLVLIHEIQYDPLSGDPVHIDFYQPPLEEETEVTVPIIVLGESPAVKNLGGTLVKNISEVEVIALPQKLPKDIKIDVSGLETFDDVLLIGDLQIPEGVKIPRKKDEILISVSAPEKEERPIGKPKEEEPEKEETKPEEKKEEEKKE